MRKGKYNINLSFYSLIAFILAFCGQSLLLGLLLGFIIVLEKDELTSKNIIQAFILSLIQSILSFITASLAAIPVLGSVIAAFVSPLTGIISLLVFIACVYAMNQVYKEEKASLPLLHSFADWAYDAF